MREQTNVKESLFGYKKPLSLRTDLLSSAGVYKGRHSHDAAIKTASSDSGIMRSNLTGSLRESHLHPRHASDYLGRANRCSAYRIAGRSTNAASNCCRLVSGRVCV